MTRNEIEAEASKAAESILLEKNLGRIFGDRDIDLVRLAVKAAYIRGLTAGKIEEMKEVIEPACAHKNTSPSRDHVRCNDCGWFKTDSYDSDWGNNKNTWFYELPKKR